MGKKKSSVEKRSEIEVARTLFSKLSTTQTLAAVLVAILISGVAWVLIKQPTVVSILLGHAESRTANKDVQKTAEPSKPEVAAPIVKTEPPATAVPPSRARSSQGDVTVSGNDNKVINNSTISGRVQQ